ncbi:hypothetical protein [Bradyrhizobium genosp. P]|uniref:hypothetical protein n=1 Tax=Bradyrhizobium genosp. P TaxID=83641 RepID=UPI003CF14F7A
MTEKREDTYTLLKNTEYVMRFVSSDFALRRQAIQRGVELEFAGNASVTSIGSAKCESAAAVFSPLSTASEAGGDWSSCGGVLSAIEEHAVKLTQNKATATRMGHSLIGPVCLGTAAG